MNNTTVRLILTLLLITVPMGALTGCGSSEESEVIVLGDEETTTEESASSASSNGDEANPFEPGSLVDESVADSPDTDLVNQNGQPVSFETLPDKPVLIGFIYTRCPMPDMCPLITRKFKKVQEKLTRDGVNPARFVLVSFDPSYDTPAVLRRYGNQHNLDFEHLDFWTGNPETIRALTDRFKVFARRPDETNRDEDQPFSIAHNMRTYLLDEKRVVRYWYRGSDWKVKNVADRLLEMAGSS